MVCKDCANAQWQLTAKGRIKAQSPGECGKVSELLALYTHEKVAPCIRLSQPRNIAIWPEYDASDCPMFALKANA